MRFWVTSGILWHLSASSHHFTAYLKMCKLKEKKKRNGFAHGHKTSFANLDRDSNPKPLNSVSHFPLSYPAGGVEPTYYYPTLHFLMKITNSETRHNMLCYVVTVLIGQSVHFIYFSYIILQDIWHPHVTHLLYFVTESCIWRMKEPVV